MSSATTPRDLVRDMLVDRAYAYDPLRPFRLASGEQSSEYIDCKAALTHPQAIAAIGPLFFPHLNREGIAVGGLTMGADPIAISISVYSAATDHPVRWFSVRKSTKDHGLKRSIEGNLPPASKIVIVEDVVTWGTSTLDAIDKCEQTGHQIMQVLALVDRQQGGMQRIRDRLDGRVEVSAIFTKAELHERWLARHAPTGALRSPT